MERFSYKLALAAFVIFMISSNAEAQIKPLDAIESMKLAAQDAVQTLNESGIHGLSKSVESCYSNQKNTLSDIYYCTYLDMAGNHIDASVSRVTGKSRYPFFDKATTQQRVDSWLVKAGISSKDLNETTYFIASKLDPLVNAQLAESASEPAIPFQAKVAQAENALTNDMRDPAKVKLMECTGIKVYQDPQPTGHPLSREQCMEVLRESGADPSMYSPLQ